MVNDIKLIRSKKAISLIVVLFLILFILLFYSYHKSIQPVWPVQEIKASNLMNGISANKIHGLRADNKFIVNTTDFSVELFKKTITMSDNILISPISAMFPLSIVANGASGDTLSQMNQVLSKDIPLETLNKYLYSFRLSLKSSAKSKFHISNSIWFRNDLEIRKQFLQINSDYYDASIYQSAFNNQTLKDINNWVQNNTSGNIDNGIDEIKNDNIVYLINTLEFDSKWKVKYEKESIEDSTFYNHNGSDTLCKFMSSTEYCYLDDGQATGFIKPYYNDHYRFVALLPNEGIPLTEYIKHMTGEKFINTLRNAVKLSVYTEMPEFHYEYSLSLEKALAALGMKDATSMNADFSKLSKTQGNSLYINDVIQTTYIDVDPKGTKAGALTIVLVETKGVEDGPEKSVILNRPFIYAIIDSNTNIPLFLGVISNMNEMKE